MKLLITGGTGTFGNAVPHRFLETEIKEIRIFLRDEKKQDEMRNALRNPKVISFKSIGGTNYIWCGSQYIAL